MRVKTLTELPTITAEHFISLGFACRPAYWLQRTGLRTCALPFDWMKNAPLDFIAESLQVGSGHWFSDYTDSTYNTNKSHRKVIDNPSGMIALHAFPTGKTVAEYLPEFHKIFDNRMARFQEICATARKICFVMSHGEDINRADGLEDIIHFAHSIRNTFPRLNMTIIQVVNSKSEVSIREYTVYKWLKIYVILADDVHQRARELGDFDTYWYGNMGVWASVLNKCRRILSYRKCLLFNIPIISRTDTSVYPVDSRIDVKNYNTSDNNVSVRAPGGKVLYPSWFADDRGRGASLLLQRAEQDIEITAENNGVLKIHFRGPDRRVDGKRFPYWVDYSSIVIDDNEILTAPVATWHDKPFVYEMPVTHGQVVRVKFTQTPHKYTDTELSEFIGNMRRVDNVTDVDIVYLSDYLSDAQK